MMMVSAARIDLSQAGMEQDFPFSQEWQAAATKVAAKAVVIVRSDQVDWNGFIKVEVGTIRKPGLDASHAVPSLVGLRRDGSFEQIMTLGGVSREDLEMVFGPLRRLYLQSAIKREDLVFAVRSAVGFIETANRYVAIRPPAGRGAR